MSDGYSRRELLRGAARMGLGAAGLALLGGCAARPGQGSGGASATRVATVGFLAGLDDEVADEVLVTALRQGLLELGWAEGRNLRLEVRLSQGGPSQLPDLAGELVGLPVDVLVAEGVQSNLAAVAATGTLPVVMVTGPQDLVERGWAASIQHPGGHVTGLLQPPFEIYGKRVELLVEAVPRVSRLAYIAPGNQPVAGALRETARALGVQVDILTSRNEGDLEQAFAAIEREAADAVLVEHSVVTSAHQARIIDFAAQRRLPTMYHNDEWTEAGGLMSYGPDLADLYRRAAFYVDRILRGDKPGDLPIEFPTRYELVINLRTATALGLTIPESVLAQASEVLR